MQEEMQRSIPAKRKEGGVAGKVRNWLKEFF
jgi:hypothetical protein